MNKIFLLGILLSLVATPVSAAEYEIDGAHTQITFKVRHLGISWVPGSFSKLEGSFTFDKNNIAASKAEAKIDVASISTLNQKRDDHLRGDDFFNAEKHPQITFITKKVEPQEGSSFKVIGDLTMHGVTKSVELDAEFTGAATDPWGNEKVAFSATTKLNRKDFGLQWNKVLETGALVVGDEVVISLDVQGTKKKS